jgi:hypothetical protein
MFYTVFGSLMVNTVPLPEMLEQSMSPPWFSIIALQLASPSPVPFCFVVNNGSNMW